MKLATALAVGLSASALAHGAITTYTDRTTFLTQTSATADTAFPNSGFVASPATNGDLTYSLGPGATELYFGVGNATQFSTLFAGNELAVSGPESIDVAINSLVFSFGFDFHEPGTSQNVTDGCNFPCTDSTFSVTLFNGATNVGTFNFNAPNDVAAFVGVWSDTAFNRVEIRETVGTADNEFYAQFYSGSVPMGANPIPEPGTLALLAGGFGALALQRLRR